MLIVDIPSNMKIAVDTNSTVIAKLEETPTLVKEPKLANGRGWGHLIDGKYSANNDTLFGIALLRDKEDLVARRRRARHPPAVSDPHR
jgi:hypothetical protein